MIVLSRKTLALTLSGAGMALVLSAMPADAQRAPRERDQDREGQEQEQEQSGPKLTKEVQQELAEAQKAQTAGDHQTALARIAAAEQVQNRTAEDNYYINMLKYNSAVATNNNQLLEQAMEGALATGQVPETERPKFVRNLAALAVQRNDFARAAQMYEQIVEANPNDTESLVALAELYQRSKRTPQAVTTLKRAIDVQQAAGQKPPEDWYRRYLGLAYDTKQTAEIQPAATALITAYPTQRNWRDALLILRENQQFDDAANLDLMRLMREAGALTGEADYAEYAEAAQMRGLPAESKAVLDEGVSKGLLDTSKPYIKQLQGLVRPAQVTADLKALPTLEKEARAASVGKPALQTGDAYLSHGNYAKAAEMYQVALQKGSVDAATVNTRLGIALAKAGRRPEAEAAFKAVQGGPRQSLANYWLIWLGQRA